MSNIQTTSLNFSKSLQQLVHFTSFKNSATSYIYILAWRSYLRQLQTNPLITKSITSGIISSLSTVLVINEFTIGLVLRAPVVHYFHTFLDKCLFRNAKQTSLAVIVAKVILDQFIFSPPFTALYYYVTALMRDEPLKPVSQKIRRELFDVMKKSWLLWIPVNAINYALIPLELRVLFANIVDVFWTAYLISTVSSKAK
ncbi:Peroxisomal membrane protein 2 [Galdieria sulphuraria]|nr:Peroxisomal membrane protein 2 [Galdieria sulphuraria]